MSRKLDRRLSQVKARLAGLGAGVFCSCVDGGDFFGDLWSRLIPGEDIPERVCTADVHNPRPAATLGIPSQEKSDKIVRRFLDIHLTPGEALEFQENLDEYTAGMVLSEVKKLEPEIVPEPESEPPPDPVQDAIVERIKQGGD